MKITLAYPYGGHDPDETVELPESEANRLLSDGKARRPKVEAGQEPTPRKPHATTSGSGRRTSKEK